MLAAGECGQALGLGWVGDDRDEVGTDDDRDHRETEAAGRDTITSLNGIPATDLLELQEELLALPGRPKASIEVQRGILTKVPAIDIRN